MFAFQHSAKSHNATRLGSLLAATLALVSLADFFFYAHPLGWTAGVYLLIMLLVLHWRFGWQLQHAGGRACSAAAAGLAGALVLQPNLPAFCLALLLLTALPLTARLGWTARIDEWISRQFRFLAKAWLFALRDARRLHRRLRARPDSMARVLARMSLWIVPMLLALVFVGLFTAANPILERVLHEAGQWSSRMIETLARWLSPTRAIFWICFAVAIWTFLRGRIKGRFAAGLKAGPDFTMRWIPDGGEIRLSTDFTLRCLYLFNGVFLLQTLMDLAFLFGGARLPEGLGYAEYAHRGAYPLVATALLAACFVLLAFRPGGLAESSRSARRLVYLWLAQNVFLTFTAIWRLHLYVEVYSLTRLRAAAALWMLLVTGGLISIGWRIVARRSNGWLVGANALMLLGLFYLCGFVPFNALIADYNVAHCLECKGEGPALDLEYLRDLGAAALPAMEHFSAAAEPSEKTALARKWEAAGRERLAATLADWRGWSWWRSRWQRASSQGLAQAATNDPASGG